MAHPSSLDHKVATGVGTAAGRPDLARRTLAIALPIVVAACTSHAAKAPRGPDVSRIPTPKVSVGQCAEPERDGVMSASPQRQRNDTDLDRDGAPETVVADRALCEGDNCHWNVFARDGAAGCERFLGTLAGATLERGAAPDGQFAPVRSYWRLGGDRLLIHAYEFQRGGYQLVDVMVCRRSGDDRIACMEPEPRTR